jgi:RNA polymerase sigma factor (sigma-70 family)
MEAATFGARSARRRMLRARSDGALVARVRGGDDAAFDALYDGYHRNLLAFCHHMLGSREEAEDVLQQTFLAAYRALRAGQDVVGLKPWLYTIARNRCLSVLRARRDHVALDDGAAATEGLAAEVDRRADLRALVRDVQRLAPDQRAALVLFELGDHSHEEIAAVLGVRREKVKALVFQAREALMGWRAARETPCEEVREQLATARGGALRRGGLRRHVEQCSGCAEYAAEVRRQRAALAIVLPVAPAVGIKAALLGSALGGSGAAAAGAGSATGATGGLAGLGANGIAAKLLVITAVAGGAGATGYVAVDELQQRHEAPATHGQRATPAVRATPASAASGGPASATTQLSPATPATPASPATPAARAGSTGAKAKARNGKGRALGRKAPKGKAAAPGQLKAPGSPAEGKALGAAKTKDRPATPGKALGHFKPKPARAKTVKPLGANSPRAALPAAHNAPGQSTAGAPGQARKQHRAAVKKP